VAKYFGELGYFPTPRFFRFYGFFQVGQILHCQAIKTTKDMITITSRDRLIIECESAVVIPKIAITEPGYIKFCTIKDSAHAKHEFHAMAQMAYFQYQDDELELQLIDSPLTIAAPAEIIELEQGMLLCRQGSGAFSALVQPDLNNKKMLETAYRYCTRWVRLDI
jgi:hypothetical protein